MIEEDWACPGEPEFPRSTWLVTARDREPDPTEEDRAPRIQMGQYGAVKQWLQLTIAELAEQYPVGAEDMVHFPESLVAAVIDEYTTPGQRVLDPFAGYGTTLVVAERMGRTAIGVELLPERADLIRARVAAEVVTGDARDLATLVTGPIDLCVTSPPYMTVTDHPQNPFTGYRTLDGDYANYLADIGRTFGQVAALLRPGGHAVINVANLRTGSTVTPLAWDIARTVAGHLVLRQEVFLCWDQQPAGISGDYCLVFQRMTDSGRTQ
jgi:SAM-dependent methyltransferase